jgi:hypothetical protein
VNHETRLTGIPSILGVSKTLAGEEQAESTSLEVAVAAYREALNRFPRMIMAWHCYDVFNPDFLLWAKHNEVLGD